MDSKVHQAYKSLAPADQLVVDAMIVALYQKDKQIRDLVKHVTARLDKAAKTAKGEE